MNNQASDLEASAAPPSTEILAESPVRPQRRAANTRKAKPPARAAALSGPEQERLRAALHDGLGQLLTSISFLATSLQLKLAALELSEADDAREIVALTSRAISETQALVNPDVPLSAS